MAEIVTAVRHVSEVISEIAAASQDQLAGIEQVSRAVTQMDQVVQQNAALVEESAAAAENQSAQADSLVKAVARFHLGDEKGTPAPMEEMKPAAKESGAEVKRAPAVAAETSREPIPAPTLRSEGHRIHLPPTTALGGLEADWKTF